MTLTKTLFSAFLLIGVLISSSCERNSDPATDPKPDVVITDQDSTETENTPEPVDTIPSTPPTVDVAVYVEYPEAIDGCACYFGRTASELSEGKYIFMTNYEKKAYMELDGQMRTFELMSSADLEDGKLMETWKNENYDMFVKSEETGQIDETWQSIGTITIKPKGKAETVMNVVGECGC